MRRPSAPILLALTMGAAAFGAFLSFPIAVAGGLGLGLVYQVVAAQTNNAGTAELAVFGAILVADSRARQTRSARPSQLRGRQYRNVRAFECPRCCEGRHSCAMGRGGSSALSLVVAVVFPLLPYFKSNQFLLVLVLIYALVGVSLTMLVGWAGQVSLGQFALVGIGAYLTAKWAGQSGWSMVELLLVAGAGRRRRHGRDRTAGTASAWPDARRDHARPGGHRARLAVPTGLVGRQHAVQRAGAGDDHPAGLRIDRLSTLPLLRGAWWYSSWSSLRRQRCDDRRWVGRSSRSGTTKGPWRRSGLSR